MTIPVKKDTAPPEIRKLALGRLYDNDEFIEYMDERCPCDGGYCRCPAPAEWMEAAALEAYVAFTETLDTWVTTLIQGRPYDTPLVEWEARDLSPHADCIPVDDVREAAEEGHRYG